MVCTVCCIGRLTVTWGGGGGGAAGCWPACQICSPATAAMTATTPKTASAPQRRRRRTGERLSSAARALSATSWSLSEMSSMR